MSRHGTLATLAFALGLAFATGLPARAEGVHVRSDQCGYNSNYDVRVTPTGIGFDRTGAQVFMHDGALRVDNRPVAMSVDANATGRPACWPRACA